MKKQIFFSMVLFFLFSGINRIYAHATYTWTGAGDGKTWTDANNWSPNTSYPSKVVNADSVIFNSAVTVTVTMPTNSNGYVLSGISVSGNASVTLKQTGTDQFNVTGTIFVNGTSNLTIINAPQIHFVNQSIAGGMSLQNCQGNIVDCTAQSTSTYDISHASQITLKDTCLITGTLTLTGSLANVSQIILDNYQGSPAIFQARTASDFTVTDGEIDINYPGAVFINRGNMTVTNSLFTSLINCTNANTTFLNKGTFNATGTNISLSGDGTGTTGSQFKNNGSAIVNCSACTFNLSGINSSIINLNVATFTADNTNFNLTGGESDANSIAATNSIYNGGIFNAINGSKFSMSDNSNIFNGGSTWINGETSTDTSFFILDPTSRIVATGNNCVVYNNYPNQNPSNTNTGVFILQSDKDNSAYLKRGPSSGPTPQTIRSDMTAIFMGQFYVQRYFTGKNVSQFRGYRLISSPVNATSPESTHANYVDFSYLNKTLQTGTNPSYPNNPVFTYHGLATGGSGAGFSIHNTNPLFYLYNETYDLTNALVGATGTKYPGITDVVGTSLSWTSTASGSNVTGTTQVPIGNGALIYFVGNNTRTDLSSATPPTNANVGYLGYINQGDITVYPWFTPGVGTLSYTSGLPAQSYPGINLVGNPYPAMIDLKQLAQENFSGTTTTFYELDDASSQANSTYASYEWDDVNSVGLTSGSNASQYVETGQGFFIQATAAGQVLTFKEDQKVYNINLLTSTSNPAGVLVTNGGKTPLLNGITSRAINKSSGSDFAGLHLMLKKDSTNFHETGIYFGKNYSDKLDKIDAIDMDGISIKTFLSSYTADGARVSINGMGTYTSGKTVKLYVKGTLDGTYSLNLTDVINIDPTIATVSLIDNYKNTTIDLVQAKTYSFDIANADTNSFGANRFVLSVQRKPLAPYQLISFNATKVKSNIAVAWQTSNEGNYTSFGLQKLDITSNKYQTIDSLQSSGTGNYVFNDPSAIIGNNTYRLAQNNIDGMVTYSQPVNIKYGLLSLPKTLGIYPNPVKDNAMFDFSGIVTNQNGGTFEVNVYNSLGVLMMQKTSTTNFLNSDLSSLKPGIYVVQVKSSNGSILGKSTFIKN